jgi:hypothetical protein
VGIGTTVPAAKLHITGAEEGIIVQGPATGNANVAYVSFVDNAGTRIGYVGDGSTGDENVFLDSDLGDVVLHTAAGRVLTATSAGNVGIGTTGPITKLTVWTSNAPGVQEGVRINAPFGFAGNGNGSSLVFSQDRDPSENNINATIQGVQEGADTSERAYLAFGTRSGVVNEKMRITSDGSVGIGTTDPQAKLDVNGDIVTNGDIRLTNVDCAEDFNVEDAQALEPGTVMVVGDADRLHQSKVAYDTRVAGVLSGAGDYRPAIILGREQSQNNRLPLALTGKVFCKVDAQYSPIGVGDLLTTSPTVGHAMKADDPLKAFGAVIGKALRPLAEGQGLIPILIALQ